MYPFTLDDFEVSLGRDTVDHLLACTLESLLEVVLKERRRMGQGYLAKVLGTREEQAVLQSAENVISYSENIYARERGWYDRDLDKDLWPLVLCGFLQEVKE